MTMHRHGSETPRSMSFGTPCSARIQWVLGELKRGKLRELVIDHLFAPDEVEEDDERNEDENYANTRIIDAGIRVPTDDNRMLDPLSDSDQELEACCEELLEVLRVDNSIRSVVSYQTLDRHVSPIASSIRHTALSLPNLVELHLLDESSNPSLVSLTLRQHMHLKVISLSRVEFECQDDVHIVAKALANCSSLTQVRLLDLENPLEQLSSTSSSSSFQKSNRPSLVIDPLVEALSTLKHLETLDISYSYTVLQSSQRISNSALTKLLQACSMLQDVSFWHLGLDDEHMHSLVPILQCHPSLTFLSLRGNPKMDWSIVEHDILPWNTALLHLYGDFNPIQEEQLNVWLNLNRRGRGRALLVEKEWWKFLNNIQHDSTSLYAFFKSDPSKFVAFLPCIGKALS